MFWILGVLLVASAVWVISAKKPVHSVIGLLLHFAILAIFYFSLSAEFLAVIQIIVYSGAILILFVFVIALLSSGVSEFSAGPDRLPKIVLPATALVIVTLGLVVYAISNVRLPTGFAAAATSTQGPVGTANVFGSVADFGRALFTTNLLPFEMTAVVLMIAVIGVILLAGDATPYVATRKRARIVGREKREAILREGGQ